MVMDIVVESKFVDISEREIVVFVMGIGGQRLGKTIRNVDPAVRERVALRERGLESMLFFTHARRIFLPSIIEFNLMSTLLPVKNLNCLAM